MKRAVRAFAGVVIAVLSLSLIGFGQTTSATIMGRVLDPSKAAVVGADVQATNVDTGSTYKGATNGTGLFSIPGVSPGNYRISVTKPGFRSIVKPDVVLHLQEVVALNFDLPVGSASEVVTVTAGAPMVNTTDASVSTVIDQTYIANMPLNGRSFQDLILLTPGVTTQTPAAISTGLTGNGVTGEFSVNGQRPESNYYTVDGVSGNVGTAAFGLTLGAGPSGSVPAATALGTTQALVSVDDLQEFRVQSSTYSAEYGRNPGGQFAFDTKSGTNQWNGTAFEYLRNDMFDANDWFNGYQNIKEPALRQNDFGGTLGGPVRIPHLYNGKDKSFFFVSYEGLRLIQPQPATLNYVPDLCMRGVDPATNCLGGRVPAPAALLPVIRAFPVPNGPPVGDGLANYLASWSNPSSLDSVSVRFDQAVSDKLRLFFRFSDTRSSAASRGTQGTSPSVVFTNSPTVRTYTAGAISSLTSRLSNDFRLNYTWNQAVFNEDIAKFGGSTPVNLSQLTGLGATAAPGFFFLPGTVNDNAYLFQAPGTDRQRQWNIVDTLGLSVGHHQLKFGVDYRRLAPSEVVSNPTVEYNYFDEPSIEANTASTFVFSSNPAYPLYKNFSAFADDQWSVLPRLNISMGLRWEVNPAPGVTRGLQAYTVQGSGPSTWLAAPQGTPLWQTSWYNFAPRLGAAYLVRNTPGWETVLRGGGGVFFDTGQQLGSVGFAGAGFSAFSFGELVPFPVLPTIPTIENPPTTTPYNSVVAAYPTHFQLPYTLQWNASVDQALGKSQAITISYVGSHASRVISFGGIQAPANSSSNGSFFDVIRNGRTSDYGSLQGQYRRRLSQGLTALASYTWSHCIDFGSQNYLFGDQRGNCDFDVRHNLSGALSYDIPNVGHNGFVNALIHHWGLDNRFTARSGFPFTVTGQQTVDPLTGKRLSNGVNFVSGQPIYIYGSQCNGVYAADFGATLPCPGGRAFNPDAFVSVSSGPGDVPRNFVRGFGAWQLDMAVRREFPINERVKLQFRAEAFNIFNHPSFGTINTGCGNVDVHCTSPTFGQATGTLANSLGVLSPLYQMGGPRSMQFALKLIF